MTRPRSRSGARRSMAAGRQRSFIIPSLFAPPAPPLQGWLAANRAAQASGSSGRVTAMAVEFGTWWLHRLREIVAPLALRGGGGSALVLRPTPSGEIGVALRRRGRERELGCISPGIMPPALPRRRPRAVVLALPAGRLLERDIILPLAACAEAPRILAHEMDRFTPFAAAEVLWSSRLLRKDRRSGQAWFRLSLLPRGSLAAPLAALATAGLAPDAVELARAEAPPLRLPLAARDPDAERRRTRARRRSLAVALALAAAATAVPFLRQSLRGARLEQELAALGPRLAEAAHLRVRLAGRAEGQARLAGAAGRAGEALALLARLTARLPDDAWLTGLTLHRGVVTLNGQAAAAARLIPLLAADPALRRVAFAAPVTRTGAGRDLFRIRATLAPASLP